MGNASDGGQQIEYQVKREKITVRAKWTNSIRIKEINYLSGQKGTTSVQKGINHLSEQWELSGY